MKPCMLQLDEMNGPAQIPLGELNRHANYTGSQLPVSPPQLLFQTHYFSFVLSAFFAAVLSFGTSLILSSRSVTGPLMFCSGPPHS